MINFDQKIRQQIKQLFKDCKIHISTSLYRRINEVKLSNLNIINYCQNYLKEHQEYQKLSYLIISICKDIQLPKCKICNNIIKYRKFIIYHCIYCSNQCARKDQQYLKKLSESHLNKTQQQKQLALQKRRQTCLQKYGVNNVSKAKEIKQKKIETCQKNFGVDFPMQSKEIMNKSVNTNLTNYGVRHVSQRPDIYQQKKLKLYQKLWNNLNRYSEYIQPAFIFQQFLQNGYDHQYWKCKKCGKIFYQEHYYYTGHVDTLPFLPRCLQCFPLNQKHSNQENDVLTYIRSIYNGKIDPNNHELIAPKQLDIVLPQLKLAIEYNGNYWHSLKQSGYHLQKTQLCQKIGYRLIHIWQDQWLFNRDEIQYKLKNIIFNKQQKFKDKVLILDRCWYNKNLKIDGYKLVEILPMQLIQREEFLVENCGYLKFQKII